MASVYRCGNKRCKQYHKEVEGLDPKEQRKVTGTHATCYGCGEVLWFVRKVADPCPGCGESRPSRREGGA